MDLWWSSCWQGAWGPLWKWPPSCSPNLHSTTSWVSYNSTAVGGQDGKGYSFSTWKTRYYNFASYSQSCPKLTDFHIVLLIIFQNGLTLTFILILTSFSKQPVWVTPSVSSCWYWPAQPGIFLNKPKLENCLSVQRLRLCHSFCVAYAWRPGYYQPLWTVSKSSVTTLGSPIQLLQF